MRTSFLARSLVAVLLVLGLSAGPASAARVVFGSTRCADDADRQARGVVITGMFEGCRSAIWTSEEDGSAAVRFRDGQEETGPSKFSFAKQDSQPSWFPDGRRLLFLRDSEESSLDTQLWTMDANGGDQRPVLPGGLPGGRAAESALVSPDGSQIAFVSHPANTNLSESVMIVRSDGSNLRLVSGGEGTVTLVAWSGDGSRLTLARKPGGDQGPTGLVSVRPDGSDAYALSVGTPLPDGVPSPRVSPNGRIALFRHAFSLFTLDLATGQLVQRGPSSVLDAAWLGNRPAMLRTSVYSAPANPDPNPGAHPPMQYALDLSGPSPVARRLPPTAPIGEAQPDGSRRAPDQLGPLVLLASQLKQLAAVPLFPALGPADGSPAPFARTAAAAGAPRVADFGFDAIDPSGVRSVRASVGLHGRARTCRFLRHGRLAAPRSCSRPAFAAVGSAAAWRRRTRNLRRGTYDVRFAATDRLGNRSISRRLVVRR